ncbi:MAG TPA: hypothetical protein DHV48_20240 [Prolixibacteraceae bacterium]|nr:hypothetical protein [Prolixibacteraceae bacterium]
MKTLFFRLMTGLFLFVLIFVSCQPKFTAEEKKSVSDEIETVVRNFLNAETLNYETHTGLRANQPGYVMGGDGHIMYRSYAGYHSAMKATFSGIQRFIEMHIVELHVYPLSKDAATCTTLFKSKFLTTAGDTLINNGCWTFVFKKFDNEWKVVQENGTHTTD